VDNLTLEFEVKYLINLPFLSEFVGNEALNSLSDFSFLNDTIPVSLPQLAIASKQYDAKLAIEKEALNSLSTRTII